MKVYVQSGKDEIDTISKILEIAKPKIEGEVLIKPNLTMPFTPESCIVTSPKVVEGIILYLKEKGIRDIVIGEGAGGALDMSEIFDVTGYKKLSEKYDIPLINLNQDRQKTLEVYGGNSLKKITLAKSCLDRFVINVPKMKTHRMAFVSLAMKNMMGAILPYNQKDVMHPLYGKLVKMAVDDKRALSEGEFKRVQEDFFKRLSDFHSVYNPQLSIIDGFGAREGDGLTINSGRKINTNYIILGENAFAADYVGSYLMGFNLFELYKKYFKKEIQNLENIEIDSNVLLEKLKRHFRVIPLTEEIVVY